MNYLVFRCYVNLLLELQLLELYTNFHFLLCTFGLLSSIIWVLTKPMKKIAGSLKLDQAAFKELEAFSKFGSDLDAATQLIIDRGKVNQEILKQAQYSPLRVEEQCAVIYSSTKGFFDGVELTKVSSLEEEFLQYINTNCKNVLDELSKGILNDKSLKIIEDSAKKIAANYK